MQDRESIWTVPASWRIFFWVLFPIQVAVYTVLIAWYEIAVHTNDDAFETLISIGRNSSPFVLISVVSTTVVVEVIFMLSVWFAEWLRKKRELREIGEEIRGEERGRQLERQEWETWLERFNQARAGGLPFDEPPPSERQSRTASYAHIA